MDQIFFSHLVSWSLLGLQIGSIYLILPTSSITYNKGIFIN